MKQIITSSIFLLSLTMLSGCIVRVDDADYVDDLFEDCAGSRNCSDGYACIHDACTFLCEDQAEIDSCEFAGGVCARFMDEPDYCVRICNDRFDCPVSNFCAESLEDNPGLFVCTPTE